MINKKISRRDFLNYVLGGGVLALMGTGANSVLRYITPPEGAETAVSSVVAAKVGELAPNSGKVFGFGEKPAIIINTPSGEIKSFTAVCTHLSCTVQYDPQAKYIWCACHNGRFDLNGKVISGPPPKPLEEYDVNVRGDEIVVSKKA